MDVLVCAAQVPWARGGLELLVENLVGALRAEGHRAEVVRLPVAWDRARLLDAAMAWRFVPLDADLVITTNFPSYFARHPRKVAWLVHQHRAAYDAVGQSWSDFGSDRDSLEVQRRLTGWDTHVLGESARLLAISKVVAHRLARFNGLTARPVYHPPPLADRLHPGRTGDYVFLPVRFAANKRPDRFVLGLAAARDGVRGVLAGSGPLHPELVDVARASGVAGRLDFRGYVDDDELVELYADCLGVIYAPHDEDYGYVTLQAFLAGKPVITAADSGGVLEWVEDGVSGLVTDGTPEGIGAAIDRLVADPEGARRMGEEGRRRASSLDWPTVVRMLIGTRSRRPSRWRR